MKIDIDEPAEIQIARHKQHLPDGTDLTLFVLKSHLLVEESLEQLIRSSCPAPNCIFRKSPNFAMKAAIARTLTDHVVHPGLWELVDELNGIRNSLAHKLDNPALEDALRHFMRLRQDHLTVLSDVPMDDARPIDRERLRSDVSLLIAQLYGWAAGMRTIVRAVDPWGQMVECAKRR